MHLAYQGKAMSYGGRRNKAQLKVIYPVFITEQQRNCTKMKSNQIKCEPNYFFLSNSLFESALLGFELSDNRFRTASTVAKKRSVWQKDRISQTAMCPLVSAQGLSP
jgi:hypothetical protein